MASISEAVNSIAQIKQLAEAIKRQQVLAAAKGIQRVQAANTQNFNAPAQNGGGGGGAAPVSTLAGLPQTPAIKDLIAKGILREGMPMEQIQAILSISGIAGQVPIDIEAMKKQLMADYAATTGDIEGAGQNWMQALYGANFAPGGPNATAFQNDPLFSSYAGGLAQMGETSDQMEATDLAWFDKQQQLYGDYYNGLMAGISAGGLPAAGGSGGGGGGGGGGYGGGGSGGGSNNDGDLGFGDTKTQVTGKESLGTVASSNTSWTNPENYQAVINSLGVNPETGEITDPEAHEFATEFMDMYGADPEGALRKGRELQQDLAGTVGGYDELERLNREWDTAAPDLFTQQINDYLLKQGMVPGDDPSTADILEPWHTNTAEGTEAQVGQFQQDPTYAATYGPNSRLAVLARAALDPMLAPGATMEGYSNVADILSRVARIRGQNQGTTDPLATVTEDTPNPEPPGTPGGVEETEPGTTTGGLTLEQMQNMDWDSLSSAQQYQLQQAGMGPMDAPVVEAPPEDTPTATGPATTTTLPALSPEQVEQLLAIDPSELTDTERQQLEAAGQVLPDAEPVGFRRRPGLYDPTKPGPAEPYTPGPGETFQNGVWTDFEGNVIGYAETETSPLRRGPQWWQQDANNGLPDNYSDLQNYFTPGGGALKASASNRLAEGVKNAIAARDSRAYNSGQRGVPVENGLFPPALLAQLEANMDMNMASSSLQHNMDLYGGKNGPTNPFDPANGPPIDLSEMMGARQGTSTPEPAPGTPEWWDAHSTQPSTDNAMDIMDQFIAPGGDTPRDPSAGTELTNMKPHPGQNQIPFSQLINPPMTSNPIPPMADPLATQPQYTLPNIGTSLPQPAPVPLAPDPNAQYLLPNITGSLPPTTDPMSQINATVPGAVTDVLDQSQGQPAIPTGNLGSITDAMGQLPANIQAAIQAAIASAGQAASTISGSDNSLQAQWTAAGEGDPLITPGTLVDQYQTTAIQPGEFGRPAVLRPDLLELMHQQEASRLQENADAAGLPLSQYETTPGDYWRLHDMSPEEINNLRRQQLYMSPLINALQSGASFIQPVRYLDKIITTAMESQGITDSATSYGDEAASLTGNELPAGDATDPFQLDVIEGVGDPIFDTENIGWGGSKAGSVMDIASFLDAERNRQAATSGKAYGKAVGGSSGGKTYGKKSTQNLASDRLKKIAAAVGRTKVLGGVR